jgi:hypothetical protein
MLTQTSVRSICNGRDHVTSVPFDWPLINEQYSQAAPFEMGNAPPKPGDEWGFFAWHHAELYQQACIALPASPFHVGVSLIEAIKAVLDLYGPPGKDGWPLGDWTWDNFIRGKFWGMREFPGGHKLLVARGTSNAAEWLQDFDAVQEDVTFGMSTARVSTGFWEGVGPIVPLLDQALA